MYIFLIITLRKRMETQSFLKKRHRLAAYRSLSSYFHFKFIFSLGSLSTSSSKNFKGDLLCGILCKNAERIPQLNPQKNQIRKKYSQNIFMYTEPKMTCLPANSFLFTDVFFCFSCLAKRNNLRGFLINIYIATFEGFREAIGERENNGE